MDNTKIKNKNLEEGSDAGSESDAASCAKGHFKSPERVVGGASKRIKEFLKKRPKPKDGQGSSSDGGIGSARKLGKVVRRGGIRFGKDLTTQEPGEPSQAGPGVAAQRGEALAMEGQLSGGTSSRALSESSGGELDAAGGSKSEQMARFAEAVAAAIKGVALKRIQSSKDKAVPAAIASIMAAAEDLNVGPPSDSMSEMRAEVTRLAAAMELLQKENKELRADLARLRGAGPRVMPQGGARNVQGGPVPEEDRVLTLVRQELAAFQSRFSALEAIVLRPPLAAGRPAPGQQQRRTTYATATAATAKSAPQSGRTPAKPVPNKPKKGGVAVQAATAPTVVPGRSAPPLKSPPADAEWQVAGEKRKAGKAARAAKRKARRQRAKKRSAAARLRAPKTAAVVITLQPEAEKRGVSYGQVIAKAKAAVDLAELGLAKGVRFTVTATGARMMRVPGAASGPTADALAERIRASLTADEARVSRPTKCADMRILGLDDSVTEGEVVAAIVRTGGCSAEQVKVGTIRPDNTGLQTVMVSCPVSAAQQITGEGRRLLVGWVSAQVKLLEPRPLRCFRCQVGHHVGVKCTSEVDRSGLCFRCGQPGHKAGSCNATPHCYVCAAAGKPAEHRAGSKACAPPAKTGGRGRVKPSATAVMVAAAATAAAAAASAVAAAVPTAAGPSQGAPEGAEMECQ